jgi:putative transposase
MALPSMMLRIAPSTYHAQVARRADPAKASPRVRQDLGLLEQIRRVHDAHFGVDGARKVWRQRGREGVAVAPCTVERLMRQMGLRGAVRGKATRATMAGKARPCPAGKVSRQFRAPHPNALVGVRFHVCGDLARRRRHGLGHRRHRPLAGPPQGCRQR